MWKYLFRIYIGVFTQRFHCLPDVCPVHRLACAGDEDISRFYSLLCCIAEQFLLQVFYNKHRPCLSLAGYGGFAASNSLGCNEPQLADTDPCTADCFQNQAKALVVLSFRRSAQPFIFRPRQFLFFRAVGLPLYSDCFHLAVRPAKIQKQAVQRCQDGIHASHSIAAVYKLLLVCDDTFLCNFRICGIGAKNSRITNILFDGGCTFFLLI